MDSAQQQQQQLPKIDFSSVDVEKPGADDWDAIRSQVLRALVSHGCFEAIYDKLSPGIRQSVLSAVSEELFALPPETKLKNASPVLYGGYLGGMPGLACESLAITDPQLPHAVPSFTNLLWAEGNPKFCDQVSLLAKRLGEVEEAVRKMLVEGLGLDDKYHAELSESQRFLLRFWEYGGKQTTAGDHLQGYVVHRDVNTLGVVCQLNEVEGLAVQTKDGCWITLKPSPTSVVVFAGDALRGARSPASHRGGRQSCEVLVHPVLDSERRVPDSGAAGAGGRRPSRPVQTLPLQRIPGFLRLRGGEEGRVQAGRVLQD